MGHKYVYTIKPYYTQMYKGHWLYVIFYLKCENGKAFHSACHSVAISELSKQQTLFHLQKLKYI